MVNTVPPEALDSVGSSRRRRGRCARTLALFAICIATVFALPSPAGASISYGFVCYPSGHSLRANWPLIWGQRGTTLQKVWFKVKLDQWTGSRWRYFGYSRWYFGVSSIYGRYYLDRSLGWLMPFPLVLGSGDLGHYFGFVSGRRSYVGPQLGPYWSNLPNAYYRTRERYKVGRATWNSKATYVAGTSRRYCWA